MIKFLNILSEKRLFRYIEKSFCDIIKNMPFTIERSKGRSETSDQTCLALILQFEQLSSS